MSFPFLAMCQTVRVGPCSHRVQLPPDLRRTERAEQRRPEDRNDEARHRSDVREQDGTLRRAHGRAAQLGPLQGAVYAHLQHRKGRGRSHPQYRIRYNLQDYDYEGELSKIQSLLPELLPMIIDSVYEINKALDEGKKVLVEGANAPMLDIDLGTYPYVTSSSASIGGIVTGLGVSPHRVGTIFGIVKAYTTRVGEGPFPTEQDNAMGEHLRSVGHEFGATTGRPRRCGWLDLVQVAYTTMVDAFDSLCLTKLDVLTGLETIKVGRKYLLDGVELRSMPAEAEDLARVEVVYDELPGWKEDISG